MTPPAQSLLPLPALSVAALRAPGETPRKPVGPCPDVRPDLAGLVKGDKVTVLDAAGTRVRVSTVTRVNKRDLRYGDPAKTSMYWYGATLKNGASYESMGYSIRRWEAGDEERIEAAEAVEVAERDDAIARHAADVVRRDLAHHRAMVVREGAQLPDVERVERTAAAALAEARARLAAIEGSGA